MIILKTNDANIIVEREWVLGSSSNPILLVFPDQLAQLSWV